MLLHLDGAGPRYAQITRALCGLIQSGALAPGTRVPPSRDLAHDLGCSRNLILLAYEQLTLEGYLASRGRAGTFVSPELPSAAAPRSPGDRTRRSEGPALLSRSGQRIAEVASRALGVYHTGTPVEIDFTYGLCEPDARMVAGIRAAFKATLSKAPFGYPRAAGDELLRQQIANRLRAGRGITRPADQVLVTSGSQQALEICARLLLNEGDRVVIEDPGYDGANNAFLAAGAAITRVQVDGDGLVVSALPQEGPPVRLVYVTPSHQFPTGAVMSASRRYALLAWARRHGAHILEDDYDSEFRYTGRPIEALAALDSDAPVIYCGTFAKPLFPALRLGYLSLPAGLVAPAVGCKWLSDLGSPLLLQRLVGELMARGTYDKHIRRMQRRYRARRDTLVDALGRHLGAAVDVEGDAAGLHLVVWLRTFGPDQADALVARCLERSVRLHSLGTGPVVFFDRSAPRPASRRAGLLLGYGIVDDRKIEQGVERLAAAYRQIAGARRARRGVRQPRAASMAP